MNKKQTTAIGRELKHYRKGSIFQMKGFKIREIDDSSGEVLLEIALMCAGCADSIKSIVFDAAGNMRTVEREVLLND